MPSIISAFNSNEPNTHGPVSGIAPGESSDRQDDHYAEYFDSASPAEIKKALEVNEMEKEQHGLSDMMVGSLQSWMGDGE